MSRRRSTTTTVSRPACANQLPRRLTSPLCPRTPALAGSTLKASWALWIPVQTINMGFVPVQQRLLFVNVVSLAWNTFLAVVAGKSGGGKDVREAAGESLPRQQDIELRGVKVK